MKPDHDAGTLREAVRLLERKLGVLDDVQSSCCGTSFAQCHAIVEIGRAERVALHELASLLGLDKSTMSRTITNLVNNDLATREIRRGDRRYIDIKLTEKGKRAFTDIEESMKACFARIYNAIPETKRTQVIESLQLLLQVFPENDCRTAENSCCAELED